MLQPLNDPVTHTFVAKGAQTRKLAPPANSRAPIPGRVEAVIESSDRPRVSVAQTASVHSPLASGFREPVFRPTALPINGGTFAVGMVVTVAAFPLLAVGLRTRALPFVLAFRPQWGHGAVRTLEIAAALAITAIGGWQMTGGALWDT